MIMENWAAQVSSRQVSKPELVQLGPPSTDFLCLCLEKEKWDSKHLLKGITMIKLENTLES